MGKIIKIIILGIFISNSSCKKIEKEDYALYNFNEVKLIKNNINYKYVGFKKSQINVKLNGKDVIYSKSTILCDEKKGLMISIHPFTGYEIGRMYIKKGEIVLINRIDQWFYKKKIKTGIINNNEKINKIIFCLLTGNYCKLYKYFSNITDKGIEYYTLLNEYKNVDIFNIYIDKSNYKVREIFFKGKNDNIIIEYKYNKERLIPEKIKIRYFSLEINIEIIIKIGELDYNRREINMDTNLKNYMEIDKSKLLRILNNV